MGIFDKFKKKKDLWEEAYQAQARIYGKEDESPVMVFTLTETVDTILPMDPANMYETEQEIGDYRLCFVSLKNNGEVIADLPFYACISQLSNYVIEQRNPFVLIKGLKLDELESLTHNINSEIEERERVNEKFHKNLDFLKSSVANFDKIQKAFSDSRVTLKTFENVNFSSGKIVAADPICYLLSREINDNLMATIEGIPVIVSKLEYLDLKISLHKSEDNFFNSNTISPPIKVFVPNPYLPSMWEFNAFKEKFEVYVSAAQSGIFVCSCSSKFFINELYLSNQYSISLSH